MSPESGKSSIDYMRSLGQPAKLPGAEEAARIAQEFPQPEFRANVPDIKMSLVNDESKNGDDVENGNQAADAAASRSYLRSGESLNSELIAQAEDPAELFTGLRRLEMMLEDTIIPQGLSERYTPPRDAAIMYEKSKNFAMTADELQELSIIVKDTYNKKGKFEAKLKDNKFLSLALKVEQKPVYLTKEDGTILKDQDGDPIERGIKTEIIIGSPEKRAEMAKANEIGAKELGVRDVIGEHIGLRINEEVRDSYETMSAYMHGGRVPKFTTEQLKTLTNLPSITELRAGKEVEKSHELGDQFEEALFCNLVMLSSNSKTRMQELLDRPGATALIYRMAEKHQQKLRQEKNDQTIKYGYEEWIKENVGNVEAWKDDKSRILKETWREERAGGFRKGLTEWSNIVAWEGNPGEFGEDKENAFIENLIGEQIVGSVEASWLATVFTRVVGIYSSEGYAALPNGSVLLPLGEDRIMSGDDFGKAYALMFNKKEGYSGRTSGLKDMIGKIPDLSISLLDWGQVVIGEEDLVKINEDGTTTVTKQEKRRSIIDAWLGTAKQTKRSLLTGEPVGTIIDAKSNEPLALDPVTNELIKLKGQYLKSEGIQISRKDKNGKDAPVMVMKAVVPEESYTRLGELNFKSLPRRFHGTYTIMQWLMGNGERPTGVNIEALKTDFEYRDFKLNDLKKIKKYVGIVMNPVVLTKGSVHLYTEPANDAKIIQKNYLRNLMYARIHSASFSEGILNMKLKLFNPMSGSDIEVPAPLIIRLAIKEILKDNPVNEQTLINYYIDENKQLRQLGSDGTGGTRQDVINVLNEKFMPEKHKLEKNGKLVEKSSDEYAKEVEQMKFVGRVTGKEKVTQR